MKRVFTASGAAAFALSSTFLSLACGGNDTPAAPASPTAAPSYMQVRAVLPQSGATISLPAEYVNHVPGGIVIPAKSGHISVDLVMGTAVDLPWAQLSVYLLTGDGKDYCGQNGPDSPTWGSLSKGWSTSYTVTGFRVTLPCDVTGVRAMLHTRNNGLLTPPSPSETVAEATFPVKFQIRQ